MIPNAYVSVCVCGISYFLCMCVGVLSVILYELFDIS